MQSLKLLVVLLIVGIVEAALEDNVQPNNNGNQQQLNFNGLTDVLRRLLEQGQGNNGQFNNPLNQLFDPRNFRRQQQMFNGMGDFGLGPMGPMGMFGGPPMGPPFHRRGRGGRGPRGPPFFNQQQMQQLMEFLNNLTPNNRNNNQTPNNNNNLIPNNNNLVPNNNIPSELNNLLPNNQNAPLASQRKN